MTQQNKIEWREVELGEVAKIDWGNTSITKESYVEKGYPAFSATGQDGFLKDYEFEGDAIILSAIGARCGKCFIAKNKWNAIKNTIIIKPERGININFLFYQINIESFWRRSGAGQPFLTLKSSRQQKVFIPFFNNAPHLQEQERIISILEKAEKLKERGKNAGDLFNEYLKSVFWEMFYNKGFENSSLDKIAKLNMGGTPSTKVEEYWKNGTINWMKSGDIKGDFIYFVPNKITKKGFDKSNTTLYPKNTIVIALNGQGKTRGTTAILKIETTSNQSVVGIVLDNKKAISEYVHFNLKFRYNEIRHLTGDDERSGLNLTILRNLSIVLPPLPLQQKFARIVEQVEKMKEEIKKTNANSEELFNSLMSKAFRGELE